MRRRAPEVGTVLDLFDTVETGGSEILLVEGEHGTGKTRLLGLAASAARERGFSVATAAADEFGQLMPLTPLLVAFRVPPDSLGFYEPSETPVPGTRMLERLQDWLKQWLAAGPALVTLDDLHWADPATLEALRSLPRQLDAYPLMWILARRTSEPSNDVDRLFGLLERDGATRLELRTLEPDAVVELMTETLGVEPEPDLVVMAEGAGGNPALLVELLTGLRDEGALDVSGGKARLISDHLPLRLRAAVRQSLDALSPQTKHLLETAAVLGRSFAPDEAAEMLGETPATLWPRMKEALAAGVLAATADEFAFRHELVWQVVIETLPVPVRQALHRQAGELLMDRRGSPMPAVTHLLEGARLGDARALARLDQAVSEVLPSSPETASNLAVKALELTDEADPGRFDRAVRAVEACTAAGQLDVATRLLELALNMPCSPFMRARLYCAGAVICYTRGRACNAQELREAAALMDPEPPGELRDYAELIVLNAETGLHDNARAMDHAAAVFTERRQAGHALAAGAWLARAVVGWDEGRLTDALANARTAVSEADRGASTLGHTHPRLALATMLADVRHIDEADLLIRAADKEIRALGHKGWSSGPPVLRAYIALTAGRLEDATADATAALEMAVKMDVGLFRAMALWVLGVAALRGGDVRTASRCMERNDARLSGYGPMHTQVRCTFLNAQITEVTDGADRAMEACDDIFDALPRRRSVLIGDPAAAAWLTRLALITGDRSQARTVVAAIEEVARTNPELTTVVAAAAHARGLYDREPSYLEFAAITHRDPWARASTAEDLGAFLAGHKLRSQAVRMLSEAVTGYDGIGAHRDAARVRRRLRGLGVRHRHWVSADRPSAGLDSLTKTERSVSELVAQGLTNHQVADQMYVSVHTVAFHLRQVFRKLNISSRVDLTRILLEHERRQRDEGGGDSQSLVAACSEEVI